MRLIDADALKDVITAMQMIGGNFSVLDVIDNAPTVTKDNRPAICFNCEHCCSLSVNSDGEVVVMCNLGAESCDKQRPRGEWKNYNAYFKTCSLCKKTVGFDYIEQDEEKFNFCPNCGADMRGGE